MTKENSGIYIIMPEWLLMAPPLQVQLIIKEHLLHEGQAFPVPADWLKYKTRRGVSVRGEEFRLFSYAGKKNGKVYISLVREKEPWLALYRHLTGKEPGENVKAWIQSILREPERWVVKAELPNCEPSPSANQGKERNGRLHS